MNVVFPDIRDRPYHLFTDEYEDLRASVRGLLDRHLLPRVETLEAGRTFPREVFEQLGAAGHLGLAFPLEAGGGADPVADAVVSGELGRTGVYGFAAAVIHHRSAALAASLSGGVGPFPSALDGSALWALALTEPGLDPAPTETAARAVCRPGGYELHGTKTFVPNAAEADVLVCGARVDERIGLFVVPGSDTVREPLDVLGWWECPLGEVRLDGVVVPEDARLGGDALETLDRVRRWQALSEAFALTGLARRALEEGMAYGLEREAFGRPVARFQVWRHRWADRATEVEMAHALAVQALRLFVHGEPSARTIAAARLHAGRVAYAVADECVQMHGGYGYMMEFAAQRFWRDARQATVLAGGDAVWLETVAAELGISP